MDAFVVFIHLHKVKGLVRPHHSVPDWPCVFSFDLSYFQSAIVFVCIQTNIGVTIVDMERRPGLAVKSYDLVQPNFIAFGREQEFTFRRLNDV